MEFREKNKELVHNIQKYKQPFGIPSHPFLFLNLSEWKPDVQATYNPLENGSLLSNFSSSDSSQFVNQGHPVGSQSCVWDPIK